MNDLLLMIEEFRTKRRELVLAEEAAARIPNLKRDLGDIGRKIEKFLDDRDLLAWGNMGWERRVIGFLLEITGPPSSQRTERG